MRSIVICRRVSLVFWTRTAMVIGAGDQRKVRRARGCRGGPLVIASEDKHHARTGPQQHITGI
mgnify:CR=1 FL=1